MVAGLGSYEVVFVAADVDVDVDVAGDGACAEWERRGF